MSREIKFRGLRIDNSEWTYGYVHQGIPETYITYIIPQTIYNGYPHKDTLVFETAFEVIPESIGQFINLKDKNGTDIYEHDILQYSYNKDTKTKETFTEIVEWDDMSEYSGFTIHKGMEFEVIGNKHTHPELLNTQV